MPASCASLASVCCGRQAKQQPTYDLFICQLQGVLQVALYILQVRQHLGGVVLMIVRAGCDDPPEGGLRNLKLRCKCCHSMRICKDVRIAQVSGGWPARNVHRRVVDCALTMQASSAKGRPGFLVGCKCRSGRLQRKNTSCAGHSGRGEQHGTQAEPGLHEAVESVDVRFVWL